MSKCAVVAGNFDSNDGAMERYRRHRPMQHDQGHSKCPWMLPSGNYSIAPTSFLPSTFVSIANTDNSEDDMEGVGGEIGHAQHMATSKKLPGRAIFLAISVGR